LRQRKEIEMLGKNKTRKLVVSVIAVLGFASAAFAYWTAGAGSGTGTAPVASGPTALTATQTTVLTAMYPGDSAQTISGTFGNSNSGPVYVATVTASIASVTGAGCDATDFTLANAVMTVGAQVPAGTTQGSWTGATLKFNNKATNQDACKGATVNLAYTIS
jgi:hypothetical protein